MAGNGGVGRGGAVFNTQYSSMSLTRVILDENQTTGGAGRKGGNAFGGAVFNNDKSSLI